MIMEYDMTKKPGLYRPGPIVVREEPSGQQVYEPPEASEVPGLIEELLASLEPSETPALIRGALAHLNLAMIHPCSDGNGRLARCLQTLVLAFEGNLAAPFASIEEYIWHNRDEYYKVLVRVGKGAWNPYHDTQPWIRFCLKAHYRQLETLRQRQQQLRRLWDAIEREVERDGLPERAVPALAEVASGYTMSNPRYRRHAGVSVAVASRELKQIVESGYLAARGEKRGRRYVAGEKLLAIASNIPRPKNVRNPYESLFEDAPTVLP